MKQINIFIDLPVSVQYEPSSGTNIENYTAKVFKKCLSLCHYK